jgi:hypothetical protein
MINSRVNLRSLVSSATTLRRESATEWSGPCPKCGGTDRFHVRSDMFFCRHCYPLDNGQHHDAIAFIRWMHNVDFREAIEMLGSNSLTVPVAPLPSAPPVDTRPQGTVSPEWSARNADKLERFQQALWEENNPGYDYAIMERGLTNETLKAFGIGYTPNAMRMGPALVLPWFRAGQLHALRYRLIDPAPRQAKLISETGSVFRGLLFGGQVINRDVTGVSRRVLALVEGELNAMSVWQVAHTYGVDVLSLGSESATLTPAAIKHAQRYGACIVWMDQEERATRNARAIGETVHACWSTRDGKKLDANDMLCDYRLMGFVESMLERVGFPIPTQG